MNEDKERAAEGRRELARAAAHGSAHGALLGLSYLAGIFIAVLPQRYRRWVEERGSTHLTLAAVASGALQFLGCLIAFILRFFIFRQQRMDQWMQDVLAKGGVDVAATTYGQAAMGFSTTFEYLIQPLTIVLIYFTFEGAVRMLAGIVTEEVVGTLPLQAVAWLHGRAEARWAEWKLGPRIADLVQKGDGSKYDLRILSCRPKPAWNRMMTIVVNEEFYEVVGEERGPLPRQFIYLLRRAPPGKIIRGHHYYNPNEALEPK
jgi:hypothetical protein